MTGLDLSIPPGMDGSGNFSYLSDIFFFCNWRIIIVFAFVISSNSKRVFAEQLWLLAVIFHTFALWGFSNSECDTSNNTWWRRNVDLDRVIVSIRFENRPLDDSPIFRWQDRRLLRVFLKYLSLGSHQLDHKYQSCLCHKRSKQKRFKRYVLHDVIYTFNALIRVAYCVMW